MHQVGIAVFLAAVFCSQPAFALTYYVSPTGSDFSAGTLTAPFQTIEKARDTVRSRTGEMTADINIILRGGIYPESAPLTLDQRDSGLNGFNVVYQAFAGETPEISGGQPITGWTSVGNGVVKASARSLQFRQLYVNGQPAVRARQTGDGDFLRVDSWDRANRVVYVRRQDVAQWRNLDKVEMVVLAHFMKSRYRVASIEFEGDLGVVTFQEPDRSKVFVYYAYDDYFYDNPFFFENAREFLDAEGEFYVDASTNEVFYKLRAGESAASIQAFAPKLENVLKIVGTTDSPAHHIRFSGITFEHSTWNLPSTEGLTGSQSMDVYADYIGNYGDFPKVPAQVYLENVHHIVLDRNTVRNSGGGGIALFAGASDNIIRGNVIMNLAGGGIILHQAGKEPQSGADFTSRNLVQNNFITRIGLEYSSSGIIGTYVDNTTIEHNELSDMPYTGISIGWAFRTDNTPQFKNLILYNDIHDVMNLLDDGAAIYTMSRQEGTALYENYLHDVIPSPWDAGFTIAAIYLDEHSELITAENNVMENAPVNVFVHLAESNTFLNAYGKIMGAVSANDFETDGSLDTDAVIANAGLEAPYQNIKKGVAVAAPRNRTVRRR